MSGIAAKIRLKIGELEIEYEGSDSFLKNDFSTLLKDAGEFFAANGAALSSASSPPPKSTESSNNVEKRVNLSTATIASRMKVKNAPDLAMAAAAHLTLAQGKEEFSRSELHKSMKSAKTYYKSNMVSNLSANVKSLVNQGRLNETATDTYALTAASRTEMEKLLA